MKTISTAIKVISVGLFGLSICNPDHVALGIYNFILKGNTTTVACHCEF